MKKLTLAAAIAGSMMAAPIASADIIGANADVGFWFSDIGGDFTKDSSSADLSDDFGLDSGLSNFANVHLEHPVPIIPNVRIGYLSVSDSGDGSLGSTFDGVPNGSVQSELTIDQFDATAYYEILDNIVSVDLGLTLRLMDVQLDVYGGGENTKNELTGVLPMVYAAANGSIPFTGVSAGAEVNGVGYSGDSYMDASAYVQYDVSVMELRGGYRHMAINFEDGDSKIDINFDGPYVSVGVDF